MTIAILLGILLIILIVSLIAWGQMRKIHLKANMVERGFTASEAPAGSALTGSDPSITEAVACVGCDYNLYGLASDGKCPECSCPIHISIPAAATLTTNADESGALDAAVPCVGCGNDLRGSRRHQLCPTCGAPAWFTLPTLWLRHCDPSWRRRVRSGLTLWLWNLLIMFLLVLGGSIAAGIWAVTVSTDLTGATMIGSTVVSIVDALLTVLIVWRISTPNPAHKNRNTDARLRQVTRAGAIMALVSALGLMVVLLSELSKFYMYVTTIIGLGGLVSAVGVFLYLREFACRVPNRKFIRSFTLIMWWLCSASLILQLLGIGSIWLTNLNSTQTPVASSPGTPSTQTPVASSIVTQSTSTRGLQPPLAYTCVTAVLGLALFGLTIWLVVALFRLRAAFRRALDPQIPPIAAPEG